MDIMTETNTISSSPHRCCDRWCYTAVLLSLYDWYEIWYIYICIGLVWCMRSQQRICGTALRLGSLRARRRQIVFCSGRPKDLGFNTVGSAGRGVNVFLNALAASSDTLQLSSATESQTPWDPRLRRLWTDSDPFTPSHGRSAPPQIRFKPDSLRELAPLPLKRRRDRAH